MAYPPVEADCYPWRAVDPQTVEDGDNGRGAMSSNIYVTSQKAFPLLDVIEAKYGLPSDNLRVGGCMDRSPFLVPRGSPVLGAF